MAASPSSSSSKLRKSVLSPKYKKEQKSTALATPRINSYSAVVAIDFGTTYSGYAYAFTSDPANVFVMDPRVQGINTAYSAQQPTVLLLTGDESFHSFGYEAQEYYRDIDESESSEMLYFEKFKMELHSIETLEEGMELIAANGRTVAASKVFAHAIRYFKNLCLYELNDLSHIHITEVDIQWVITVPAIWRPSARQFMRRAAIEANVVTTSNPKQLILALEPEAASVYCQQLELRDLVPPAPSYSSSSTRCSSLLSTSSSSGSPIHHPSSSPSSSSSSSLASLSNSSTSDNVAITSSGHNIPATSMRPGSSYIVADCGGGTIDLTVHQIEDNGRLKELCKSSGGAWGSIGVDCQFEMLLVTIFGERLIQDFINKHPVSWLELMKTFETKKRLFNPSRQHAYNVSLPFAFIHHYTTMTHQSVEQAITLYNDEYVQWSSQGMIRLLTPAMNRLFDPVVNTIVKHIHRILSHSNHAHIQYLFLVGGFAESPVLQRAIREAFGSSIRIIIPHDMSLCILKGAVMYGLDPKIVHIRQSVLTYGVACLHKFDSTSHPLGKKVVKDGGIEWCTEVFDTFISAGQAIPQGYSITRSYKLARSSLQSTVLTLFATQHKSVQFVTDRGVKKIGELYLKLPSVASNDKHQTREIHMTMAFGDTEVTVKGFDSKSEQTAFAQIDFLCKK